MKRFAVARRLNAMFSVPLNSQYACVRLWLNNASTPRSNDPMHSELHQAPFASTPSAVTSKASEEEIENHSPIMRGPCSTVNPAAVLVRPGTSPPTAPVVVRRYLCQVDR